MRMARSLSAVVIVPLALMMLPDRAGAADCGRARDLQAQAREMTPKQRLDLLESAAAQCEDDPSILIDLAEAEVVVGNPNLAMRRFQQVAETAQDVCQRARALAGLGRVYRLQGEKTDAVQYLRSSLKLCPDPAVEADLLELQWTARGAIVGADEIRGALQPRSAGVEPGIDLQVNFESNSFRLSPQGRTQVDEVARVIESPELRDARIRLIGHTDQRGSDDYNLRLSEQRAQSVRSYLIEVHGAAGNRLVAEGRGKREPLYRENNERAWAMNRRVEIAVGGR
jgi:outer membrane protein OmpA-like peptidoglycan-associated protein